MSTYAFYDILSNMSKIDSSETDKKKTILKGTTNDYDIKIAEDYLKQKEDGTLHISDFDDFLEECGIDKETL